LTTPSLIVPSATAGTIRCFYSLSFSLVHHLYTSTASLYLSYLSSKLRLTSPPHLATAISKTDWQERPNRPSLEGNQQTCSSTGSTKQSFSSATMPDPFGAFGWICESLIHMHACCTRTIMPRTTSNAKIEGYKLTTGRHTVLPQCNLFFNQLWNEDSEYLDILFPSSSDFYSYYSVVSLASPWLPLERSRRNDGC